MRKFRTFVNCARFSAMSTIVGSKGAIYFSPCSLSRWARVHTGELHPLQRLVADINAVNIQVLLNMPHPLLPHKISALASHKEGELTSRLSISGWSLQNLHRPLLSLASIISIFRIILCLSHSFRSISTLCLSAIPTASHSPSARNPGSACSNRNSCCAATLILAFSSALPILEYWRSMPPRASHAAVVSFCHVDGIGAELARQESG
ncbi:hypothetical protein EDC01DRAFT_472614 [Geopyxis carbonaria]|nr:hypothetical protein EDC01DRAFT_472614 [Geopyxis carbonaria]